MTACGAISKTQLGERVLIDGRVYVVCGFSPMSVQPPRLLLEDAASGAQVEIPADRAEPLAEPRT